MGSGCNNSNNNKWFQTLTPDTGVKYTGTPYPNLGICAGDLLSEIEIVILDKIQQFTTGQGIVLESLSLVQCDFIKQFTQCCVEDKSLLNVADVILKAICALNTKIEDIQETINNPYVYDLKCLTVANPTVSNVIQELINQFCILQEEVNTFIGDFNNGTLSPAITNAIYNIVGDFLLNNINSCANKGISKSGVGSQAMLNINALVPPKTALPYYGDTTDFNTDGSGKSSVGLCGWYICDGRNGTPDMRGYAAVGATNLGSVSTVPLDNRVDPTVNGDADYSLNLNQKKGEVKHTLVIGELPSHTHTLNDPGHKHTFTITKPSGVNAGSLQQIGGSDNLYPQTNTISTTGNTTGITINSTGSGFKHENRQPSNGCIWIMRFS